MPLFLLLCGVVLLFRRGASGHTAGMIVDLRGGVEKRRTAILRGAPGHSAGVLNTRGVVAILFSIVST